MQATLEGFTPNQETAEYRFYQCRACRVSWPVEQRELAYIHARERAGRQHRAVYQVITGKVGKKMCGGACLTAIGPDCECSCAGKNHGRYAV